MNTPSIGDNSNLIGSDKMKLRGFISEIERLEDSKREIGVDISEIYKSAKESGFNTKAMRHTIRMRRMEREDRDTFENACNSYALALGDLIGTPLGDAAVARDLPPVNVNNPPFNAADDSPRVAQD